MRMFGPWASLDAVISGENATRINAILDLYTVPARFNPGVVVEYPDDPVTTATDNVTNQSTLDTALAAGNGRLINVAAGSYTSLPIASQQTDLDIVLADTASFSGGITVGHTTNGPSHRIRITGGDFNGGLTMFNEDTHILLDNVNIDGGSNFSSLFVGPQTHVALINTTITANASGVYGILAGAITNFIVGSCDISNDFSTQAGIRLVGIQNFIMAGGRVFSSGNRIFRVHADGPSPDRDANLTLSTGNQYESDADHNIWIGPESGVDHGARITRTEFWNDRLYMVSAGISDFVMQTDSNVNETSGGAGDGVDDFIVNGFDAFSPEAAPLTGNEPANYSETSVTFSAYEAPPAFSGGADH